MIDPWTVTIVNQVIPLAPTHLRHAIAETERYVNARKKRGDYESQSRSRRVDPERAASDDRFGKMAEWVAAYALHQAGWPDVHPDCEVYPPDEKDWSSDLRYDTKPGGFPRVAVKAAPPKMASWTFQVKNSSGGGGRDRLLDLPNEREVCAFLHYPSGFDTDWMTNAYVLCLTSPWRMVHPFLRSAQAPQYKDLKICAYAEDFENGVHVPTAAERKVRGPLFWDDYYRKHPDAERAQVQDSLVAVRCRISGGQDYSNPWARKPDQPVKRCPCTADADFIRNLASNL